MKNITYFDNASTSYPKFKNFYEDTMNIYEKYGVNFSRNNSEKSKDAKSIKENLIKNIKTIFKTKNEVILNSSATFSLNEIILGLDYTNIKTVYISPFEHNSVYRVLKRVIKEKNIDIKVLKFHRFDLDFENMKLQFMSKKPDLIICNHASNVFGNILPVKDIFEEGKKYDAITILDATQTGGVLDFSEISISSDFIVFAGHKNLYGPSGIGGYIYNKNVHLKPLLYGGTGINSEDEDMPEELPERFEAGSPNILGIIGLKISTDELLKIGIENIKNKKQKNIRDLYDLLEEYSYDLKILSDRENNVGVISIEANDYTPQELENIFNDGGIITRRGLHCAPLAHKHMETDKNGTLRLSVGYFNDEEDLYKLTEVLESIF
ncbi:aminotransferase class V-fold PLP-dependent enzyme [Cetobacterium somerae]|uniref:aminotransferase class V-fold PLP-dependent enzyme n=1 Tax=Cetobacterium sp. NK01 TaxID=2993530 RepID=UPI0021170EAE|nr:aminotransferase class V-fold PLP-dependent enzyme [Cetobacterium sp. NK01]MCQ8211209.1 aminotransferase class V-fold PLP-dependent enzyme [Cetobacterium sp. NK01]